MALAQKIKDLRGMFGQSYSSLLSPQTPERELVAEIQGLPGQNLLG